MKSSCTGLGAGGGGHRGVFCRLQVAGCWLRAVQKQTGQEHEGDCDWGGLAHQLQHFCLADCVREAVDYIEALDYFMMDMKAGCLFRYGSLTSSCGVDRKDVVVFDCTAASLCWVVIQVAYAIITQNTSDFIVPEAFQRILQATLLSLDDGSWGSCISFTCANQSGGSEINSSFYSFSFSPLLHHETTGGITGGIIIPSISPSLQQLLHKEVQTLSYLQENYSNNLEHLTDEFDLLDDEIRARYVTERSMYLLATVRRTSEYYSRTLSSDELSCAPVICGQTLLDHVHPYGSEYLSASGALKVPNGHDSFSVAFASGGSTGKMKFVYRSAWEDQENSRYLGKGLYAAGIRNTDVVVNFLSAGFWGGMHVFNLALSYTGCAVLPLGPAFSSEEVVAFLRQLRPTALLGMPSFIMTLVDYIAQLHVNTDDTITISKIITGGEMMLPAMEKRIQEVLHVDEFLSTGYTSNETGAIGFRCPFLPTSHFHVHENMTHVSIRPLQFEIHEQQDYKDKGPLLREHQLHYDQASPAEKMRTHNGFGEMIRTGKIVATNLNRTLMPMIRYEIGDMGRFVVNESSVDNCVGDDTISTDNRNGLKAGGQCRCGRRLQVLQLLGRCDNRIRLGAEDLYLDEVPKCLDSVKGVSLTYSLHVTKSARHIDHISLHVEAMSRAIAENVEECHRIKREVLISLGEKTQLVWAVSRQTDDDALFVHMMTKKIKLSEAFVEMPDVIVHAPNAIPRNSRTGKIQLLVDAR